MKSFNELKRNLKKEVQGLKKIKLAILSDSASQLLNIAIKGMGIEYNLDLEIFEADYNQIDFQILNPGSELYEQNPAFIFINLASERQLNDFYQLGRDDQSHFADKLIHKINTYLSSIKTKLKGQIIINNLPEINDSVFGSYASKIDFSFIYQIRKFNLELMNLARQNAQITLVDFSLLQSDLGRKFSFDSKMYVQGDLVYSIDFLPHIAKSIVDILKARVGIFIKCIILDLDDTLWGGIIGDDGMEGIQIGHFGVGKAFTEFQLWIKELKRRGILIAICSKNTESIAKEPFIRHHEMVLRLEDIAVFVANWDSKASNIRNIKELLNIGFDSMLFIDDNPFERGIVRSELPEVLVPEMPEDPAEYLPYLRSLNLFETATFSEEDENRTKQYQEEFKRKELETSFTNVDEYLKSLKMVSNVESFNSFNIPRIAQLTQRSNQFNLRTIRYSESELKQMAFQDDFLTFSLSLEDRFGDHGLIGIVILKKIDKNSFFIDSWIMSCRVLKRGMEAFTLNSLVESIKEIGGLHLIGEYIPTAKNGIVKDHYLNLGFSENHGQWHLELSRFTPLITFIENHKQHSY